MIKHETDCKVHVVIKTFDNARLEANLLTGNGLFFIADAYMYI